MKTHIPGFVLVGLLLPTSIFAAAVESGNTTNNTAAKSAAAGATPPRSDAKGNPLRRAATGHVSNYDEAKVGTYTLPEPLVLQSGEQVRTAEQWVKQRRPEIVKLYENEIYGRIPERAPKVTFTVMETDTNALEGVAIRKHVVGRLGDSTDAPTVNVFLYTPAKAKEPVPVLLHMMFFGSDPARTSVVGPTNNGRPRFSESGPLTNILARGYGYATLRYTEFESDSATNNLSRARKLALAPGQTKPAPDEWGTISVWAWGASRVLDYLETEPAVDAKRVAIIGHSRLGKTALWAGAHDPRFALVYSSCAGEMGSSLARRDYGETVDDMAQNFPWQFAGNFQKYSGHWNDMPVDAHMVIALDAPRPVFITGGTQDQWADPRGEFLAEVAAGPVYRLLGQKDLGETDGPPPSTAPPSLICLCLFVCLFLRLPRTKISVMPGRSAAVLGQQGPARGKRPRAGHFVDFLYVRHAAAGPPPRHSRAPAVSRSNGSSEMRPRMPAKHARY